jgi:predicted metal-dependent hydrolase
MSIPIPRKLDVDLTQVPKHWMANNVFATAVSNGVNMLFPHGERFFVRSVKHYLEQIDDPELKAQVLAFFKQEGHHAKAHDTYNDVLRAHGYQIDEFLALYRKVATWLESKLPPEINLATTAAAEHFTAIMADGAFTKNMLDKTAPGMRELLAWHAAEEIEHKSVAFDVLQQVDPRYRTRIAGLAWATIMLGSFWMLAAITLMRQEKVGIRTLMAQARAMREVRTEGPIIRSVFLRGIREYIRKDFHPRDNENQHLAAAWFAAHGMAYTEAV